MNELLRLALVGITGGIGVFAGGDPVHGGVGATRDDADQEALPTSATVVGHDGSIWRVGEPADEAQYCGAGEADR